MSSATWTKLAIFGVILHATAFGVLHVLEPQLSVSGSIISDYAQTDSGWLTTGAFLAFALVWASLALALSVPAGGRPLIQAGRLLLGLAVVGIVVGAVAPSTADPRTGSLVSRVQSLVARPGLFLGVLLVSVGLLAKSGWTRIARWLTALSVLGVVTLAVTVRVLLEGRFGGLGQRFVFLLLYIWAVLLAARLSRDSGEGVKTLGGVEGAA